MWLRTLFADVRIRFSVGGQNFFGAVKVAFDDLVFVRNEILYIVDSEKFFNVDFALSYVFAVYADNVRTRNVYAAFFENVFLIRHVDEIIVFQFRRTFHFVNCVSAVFFAQDIHRAV